MPQKKGTPPWRAYNRYILVYIILKIPVSVCNLCARLINANHFDCLQELCTLVMHFGQTFPDADASLWQGVVYLTLALDSLVKFWQLSRDLALLKTILQPPERIVQNLCLRRIAVGVQYSAY